MRFYMLATPHGDKYLPALANGYRYGHTFSELVPVGSPRPPRLFATRRAAACALTWWRKGHVGGELESDDWGDIKTGPSDKPIPQPGRAEADIRITPVTIVRSDHHADHHHHRTG